ncbi:MAG: VOC family protein [Thermoleophilia bacterium]|nr:VOC family protein [Thermoleophilia bacterium]MDH4339098.1 VOC family protein [Thermoleophilia bacterium]MDH5280851.1 VOC family protein [Thermoleophilia bacterium]
MIDIQRVDFVAIPTRDAERAVTFYGETLGIPRNPSSHESFPEFETSNVTLALYAPESMGMEFKALPMGEISFRVPDVAEARAKLEEAGVVFEGETFDSGVCHMAFFKDPDGNGLMIHRRYAPYADGSTP